MNRVCVYSFVTLLSAFTTINLLFWSYEWSGLKRNLSGCSPDSILVLISSFLDRKGRSELSDLFSDACSKHKISDTSSKRFQDAVRKMLIDCSREGSAYRTAQNKVDSNILTLFTTWNVSPEKNVVHNNTVINWSSFLPKIQIVLFANDSALLEFGRHTSWTVLPILEHSVSGVPIFRSMFETTIKLFNSTFYAYANSDILFDQSLLETVYKIAEDFNTSSPMLITGRRTNVPNIVSAESSSLERLQNIASTRGELFENQAEDYFIATKSFPWKTIPNLVVGRVGYDNWIVAHARCSNVTVIDATRSLLALHQTTEAGNFEGFKHKDAYYNDKLVHAQKLSLNYLAGTTDCARWITYRSLCGYIGIDEREIVTPECRC